MKPSIQTLGQILYSPSQYVIPVFQRNYRWDRPQWEKLWNSLLDIQDPGKTGNHFMGFLVFVPGLAQPGQHTRFHLIDGQQRLTTNSLLLAAIRNVAREHDQIELADEIHDYFLVHPNKKGVQHFRLLPKEHDQDSYIALVTGKTDPTGRMADALDYFEQQLGEQCKQDTLALRRILDVAIQRLEFMCATLEAENAYNIFKSLNSTGVPLGQSDLIRNFVFMHVPPDDQDEFDKELWAKLESGFTDSNGRLEEDRFSRFFRDVLMMDGRYVQPKETFSTFESRHEATSFSPKSLTQDLLIKARHYSIITGLAIDESTEVSVAVAGLNALESSTTYPVLLELFRKRAEGIIDSIQLTRCIKMLQGFILRRFICNESSRGYGQMFVRALTKDITDPVTTLETYLLDRGWPDDCRFEKAFVAIPLYQRGYTKTVLETIERARGHKESVDLSAAQVEHVMPQTLNAAWIEALGLDAERIHAELLHRPGNLTLSGYNQELSNQAFEKKRDRFAQSNISLTRELTNHSSWDESTIKERGEALAREARALWIGPEDPYIPSTLATNGDEPIDKQGLRLRFWTGLSERLAEFNNCIPSIEPRASRTLRLSPTIRHIGTEIRHTIQPGKVAIDVYFWRATSRPLWDQLRADPSELNRATESDWSFDQSEIGSAWMTISLDAPAEDESTWPTLYDWFANKLDLLYSYGVPLLRERMVTIAGAGRQVVDSKDATTVASPTKKRQLKFWNGLKESLADQAPHIKLHKPLPQHWYQGSLGRSGFLLTSTVSQRTNQLGVEIYIECKDSKLRFAELLEQKISIESDLGFHLDWQPLPDAHACRIRIFRLDSPLDDESRWNEYYTWLADRIVRMDAVFRPIIRNMS